MKAFCELQKSVGQSNSSSLKIETRSFCSTKCHRSNCIQHLKNVQFLCWPNP